MDCADGRIYPPRENEMVNLIKAKFERIARSESRRFRILAIVQTVELPVCIILAAAAMAGHATYLTHTKYLPYGLEDIRANFRRARAAWQSYLDFKG